MQDTPTPPKAPRLRDFEPDPIMPANREHAQAVYDFLRAYPALKDVISKITTGPSIGTMETMVHDSKGRLPIDAFEQTNLMGLFDSQNKEISLNPGLTPQELMPTIGHEFAHASGIGSEGVADLIGTNMAKKVVRRRKPK
jgi:hypothetical protein